MTTVAFNGIRMLTEQKKAKISSASSFLSWASSQQNLMAQQHNSVHLNNFIRLVCVNTLNESTLCKVSKSWSQQVEGQKPCSEKGREMKCSKKLVESYEKREGKEKLFLKSICKYSVGAYKQWTQHELTTGEKVKDCLLGQFLFSGLRM